MERLISLIKPAISYSRLRGLRTLQKRWISSSPALQYQWEPDLKLGPDIPEYETLNMKIQGYEHTVLQSFAKYVHRIAVNLDIDSVKFPVPAKKLEIKVYQIGKKAVVGDTFNLDYYERVVQLKNLPSTKLPILIEVISSCTPEGVTVTLKKNTEEDEEFLYLPDYQKRKIEEMIEEVESRKIQK